MNRRVGTTAGLAVVLMAAFGAPVRAQAPHEADLVVRVQGEPADTSGLQLTLAFGASVESGVVVRSEPSHATLLVVLDPAFAQTARGTTIRKEAVASGAAVVVSGLSQAEPRVVVRGRPAGDTRVTVGRLAADGEDLVSDAAVGEGAFGFATFRSAEPGGERATHCCENPPCPYRCVTCSGPSFTCCGPPDCDLVCGHVNCTF